MVQHIAKWLYLFSVLVFTFAGALYAPAGAIYGHPDSNIIGSLMYTNPSEASEFLSSLPAAAWLLSLAVAASGLATAWSSLHARKHAPEAPAFYYGLAAFLIASALWSPLRNGYLFSDGLPEVRFTHDIYQSSKAVLNNGHHFAGLITKSSGWKPQSLPGQHKTYILVIGESARRDYLHAYGGKYANTPWLDNAPVTLFTNYISSGASTVPSLTNTLARRHENAIEINNNILTLASSAGFATWWISNQGRRGFYDSPVALMGESANHPVFLKSTISDDKKYSPDDQLLPLLDNALKQGQGKKLIVLHLMGSHPLACVRTNNQFDIDVGAKEISCYIKSIAITDQLLNQIHTMAEREGGDWSMMYFSDHGLSYINRNTSGAYLTHGDKSRENYSVPFFITDNHQQNRVIIQARRSSFDFLEIFSQWLKIRDPGITQTCDMLSNQNCSPVHQVLNSRGKLIDYDALPSVP